MNTRSTAKDYKQFWAKMSSPAHPFDDSKTFDKYTEEIMFYLKGAKIIVDTGCGSGETLVRIAPYFDKIYGLDYSASMIDAARERINSQDIKNIQLINDDMLNLEKHVHEKVDCIFNSGVIQYLTHKQLSEFIAMSDKLLKPGGKIVLMNIPDKKCFDLYAMQFYKTNQFRHFLSWSIKYFRYKFHVARKKIKNPSYVYDGDIGNWYSVEDIINISGENGFSADVNSSMFMQYGYRFHAVLLKKE